MNALNFDDISKQWVELTETGFENNPDIPQKGNCYETQETCRKDKKLH